MPTDSQGCIYGLIRSTQWQLVTTEESGCRLKAFRPFQVHFPVRKWTMKYLQLHFPKIISRAECVRETSPEENQVQMWGWPVGCLYNKRGAFALMWWIRFPNLVMWALVPTAASLLFPSFPSKHEGFISIVSSCVCSHTLRMMMVKTEQKHFWVCLSWTMSPSASYETWDDPLRRWGHSWT